MRGAEVGRGAKVRSRGAEAGCGGGVQSRGAEEGACPPGRASPRQTTPVSSNEQRRVTPGLPLPHDANRMCRANKN